MGKSPLVITIFAVSALLLAGCKSSKDGGLRFFGGSSYSGGSSSLSGGGNSNSAGGGANPDGGSILGGSNPAGWGYPVQGAHNPEPATVALLAGGFAAFVFLRRKRK